VTRRLDDAPILAALLGAFCIAFSSIFFELSHTSPSTGAFFRCFWAIPLLWMLARREDGRYGKRDRRARLLAGLAAAFFVPDLILWHRAIEEAGAGLSTVLANLQVVLVAPVAWLVLGERPRTRALLAIPVSLGGVVLISGVVGAAAFGRNPALGAVYGVLAGCAYTGFLLSLRASGADTRRIAGPLCDVTVVSAILIVPIGFALGDLDLTPSPAATGWLVFLGLSSQVLGWLLIGKSLPRLPAALTSILLTCQPVLTVLLAAVILGEHPSLVQLSGVAVVVAAVLIASSGPVARTRAEPALAD
jgi:drug/metabolite transporter (DMT)-like permease